MKVRPSSFELLQSPEETPRAVRHASLYSVHDNRPAGGSCIHVSSLQGPVYFWSYMYYLSKFYELLDTVILVVKVRESEIRNALKIFS